MRSFSLVLLLVAAVCVASVVGKVVYVAQNGNDANDGTSAGAAVRTLKAGFGAAASQDTVAIGKPGTYNEQTGDLAAVVQSITLGGSGGGNLGQATLQSGGTVDIDSPLEGKSTLIKKLMTAQPDRFGFSCSHTTRNPRPGEEDGVAYHFVSVDRFGALKAEGAFIETAEFAGNFYGTSIAAVNSVVDEGRVCLLDIDLQGVQSVKAKEGFDAAFIMLVPPSVEELERRLKSRGDTTPRSIAKRLARATEELKFRDIEGFWDHVIENDDLETAFKQLCAAVDATQSGLGE